METGTINTHTDSTTTMIAAERRGGAGGAGGGGGGAERVARSHANPDPDPDPHPGHSNPNPAAATTTTTTTSYVANPLSSSVPSPFLSSSSSAAAAAAAAAAASSPAAASGSSTSFVVSSPDPFTSRYTWNSYLAEEFHALAGESTWCVPVMHGSVQRRTLSLYGRDVTVTLGTNSSTHQHINISTNPNQ